MEVVIAIGIVGFVVPLIMAALTSSTVSRRNAEADTRSAWLAKHVQQQVIAKWAEPTETSEIDADFPFPNDPTAEESTAILIFDRDGEFISEGTASDQTGPSKIPDAAYVVTIIAERYSNSIAQIIITVRHPAKTTPGKRGTYRYKLLSTRQGIL
jgi:type II secretory pathway pseudopilin PulG